MKDNNYKIKINDFIKKNQIERNINNLGNIPENAIII